MANSNNTSRFILPGSVAYMTSGCLFALITFSYVIVNRISPPFWDHWSWLEKYYKYGLISPMFSLHNEHRLVIPSLFYALDQLLFNGTGLFLTIVMLIFQFVCMFFLIFPLWKDSFVPKPMAYTFVGLVLIIMSWLIQSENLFWPFQVCLVFSTACMLMGVTALCRSLTPGEGLETSHYPGRWFTSAIFCGTLSTFSFAYGMVIWPTYILLLIIARGKARHFFITITAFLISLTLYFKGYVSPAHHNNPMNALFNLFALIDYIVIYFGAPFYSLSTYHSYFFNNYTRYISSCFGIIISLVFVIDYTFSKKKLCFSNNLNYIGYVIMCLGASFITAVGRINFTSNQALSSRYSIIPLIFWLSLSALSFIKIAEYESKYKGLGRFIYCTFIVYISILIIPSHMIEAYTYKQLALEKEAIAISISVGVADHNRIQKEVFPVPGIALETAALMKASGRSLLARPELSFIGSHLHAHYAVVEDANCKGYIDSSQVFPSGDYLGVALRGWSWDFESDCRPPCIVFVDDESIISGFAVTGLSRPDVSTAYGQKRMSNAGWTGYARMRTGATGSLTAYAVSKDGLKACRFAAKAILTPEDSGTQ